MKNTITFYPPYSIVFVSDEDMESAPISGMDDRCILSNDKAILVPCRAEPDGDTKITLRPAGEISRLDDPYFDGVIATPLGRVCVSTCHLEIVLSAKASSDRTRVRIWMSDRSFPDDILVGFD